MTNPKWAHATDQGRFYQDPKGGPDLPSVTNCIDHADGTKTPGLVGWAAKVTTEYAWEILPRMVAASRRRTDCKPERRDPDWQPCTRCYGCLTRELKARRDIVRETASDLGTRIHDHADAHLTGRQIAPDPEVDPYLAQYLRFLEDFDVQIDKHVEAAEATVFNRPDGYAGTLDVLLWLALDGVTPDGKTKACDDRRLWLVDLKTSATKPDSTFYTSQQLQLVALRRAKTMLLPDDTEVPMPKVAGTAILNLRTKSYGFIPVPTGTADYQAFQHAIGITQWSASLGPAPKPINATGVPKRAPRAPRKTTPKTEKAA